MFFFSVFPIFPNGCFSCTTCWGVVAGSCSTWCLVLFYGRHQAEWQYPGWFGNQLTWGWRMFRCFSQICIYIYYIIYIYIYMYMYIYIYIHTFEEHVLRLRRYSSRRNQNGTWGETRDTVRVGTVGTLLVAVLKGTFWVHWQTVDLDSLLPKTSSVFSRQRDCQVVQGPIKALINGLMPQAGTWGRWQFFS